MLGHHVPGDLQHLLRRSRVQRRRVLVQQQQLGGIHGCHEQRQGLALSAGQQAHRLAHPVLQPHVQQGQTVLKPLPVRLRHGGEPPAAARGQGQILLNGHVGGGAPHGVLEQPADLAAALVGGQIGDVLPVQGDGALVHIEVPGDGVEQGGFARPVGAHDGDEIPRRQLERQAAQGLLLVDGPGVEGLGNVLDYQHIHVTHLSFPPARGASASGTRPTGALPERRWPPPR